MKLVVMVEDGGLWQKQDGKQFNFGFGIYKGVSGMTRREEIEKAAHEFYKGDEVSTFVVAAQWADKTMIEKATQWFNEHLYSTPIFEHDEDENPVNYVCASCCDSVEEFIENFRKAIEE